MASLPTRTTASFSAIVPVLSLDPLDAEFNQYVGATGIFNGGTTATKLLVKTSDANDPPLELDQIGAGPLAEWKQNGTLKVAILNSGKLDSSVATGTAPIEVDSATMCPNLNADMVDGIQGANIAKLDTHKAYFSLNFHEPDPSTGTVASEDRQKFIFPPGTGMKLTALHVSYGDGSHTSGGEVVFTFRKRNSSGGGASDIGSVTLDNTNSTRNVVYGNDIGDVDASTLDTLTYFIASRSGTISERSVTLTVHGYQLLSA